MNEVRFAGFWERFVALLIDGLLVFVAELILSMIGLGVLTVFAVWLYFALMESSPRQATLGKQVMKLQVTDLQGNRITFGRATGRYFSKIISSFIFCIGYILAAFTDKKQALHDMIASTLVYNMAPGAVTQTKDYDNNSWNDTYDSSDYDSGNSSID